MVGTHASLVGWTVVEGTAVTAVVSVELRVSLALAAIRTANARLATRTAAAKPGRSWWCHGRVLVVEVGGCRDIWARWAEYQWWYCSVNFTPASPGNSVASFSNALHTECTDTVLSLVADCCTGYLPDVGQRCVAVPHKRRDFVFAIRLHQANRQRCVLEDAINDKLWQEFEQWAFGSPRGTGDG